MQGTYRPINPQKYIGDISNITFRSSWELKFMQYLDTHPSIVNWSSEEIAIPYLNPITGKYHRYFPDFLIKKIDNTITLIEIKPEKQTKPPQKRGKKTEKKLLSEKVTYAINKSKWKSANIFCEKNGWKFLILTEKELGIK